MTIPALARRRSPLSFSLACLAASAALLAACGKGDDPKAAANAAPQAMPVTVIRVSSRPVPISLEAVGQAEGSREVEIRARVNGILEKRLYQEGAPVAAGAPLFLIDPAPYELAVQQAQAALVQERVRRELAQTEAQRLEPLVQEKAISQREVDQALATAKQATAAIAAAEAKLKEAQLNLSYTRLTAPIAGITGRALRSEGSLITANAESSLLTTLTQVDPIWVRFSLAEGDFNRIRGTGAKARVQLVADDSSIAQDHGRINFSATAVDARTGAVQLRAEFPNHASRWLPGQFFKVRVLAGEQIAMLVPQAAISQGEQSRVVMTVGAENKVVPKPVQAGSWIGGDIAVTKGLAEGDLVIIDNLVKVRPGATVQPKPLEAAPAKAAAR